VGHTKYDVGRAITAWYSVPSEFIIESRILPRPPWGMVVVVSELHSLLYKGAWSSRPSKSWIGGDLNIDRLCIICSFVNWLDEGKKVKRISEMSYSRDFVRHFESFDLIFEDR